MNSTAKFSSIVDLAAFCAELTKQGIRFAVAAYDDSSYIVDITGY